MQVFGKRDTGEWVEASGVVHRLLPDEDGAERHQRFVVMTGSGQSLLVAHNLDVAERVPLGMGDRVRFRGIFEHNELGGVVHWTHGNPHGTAYGEEDEEGGWILFRRRRYG